MVRKIFLTAAASILLILSSCNSNPVAPSEDQPGRRDYIWTIDTLASIAPYNSYTSLWGPSPQDIWAVGNNGDADKTLLHFDGTKWSIHYYTPPGEWIDAWSIFGFSSNDFWIGEQSGYLYRFLDGQILKHGPYMLAGYQDIVFSKFWGNNKNDIYACGSTYRIEDGFQYAILMHYNGNDWNYTIQPKQIGHFFEIKRGIKDNESYYMLMTQLGDSIAICEQKDGRLKVLKYDYWTYNPALFAVNDRIYFYFDKKLHKYVNDEFIVYKDLSNSNVNGMKIFGRNINDFFINTTDGIGHYNGDNLETIFKTDEIIGMFDAVIFKKEVFFLVSDNTYKHFYIVHGKLKE